MVRIAREVDPHGSADTVKHNGPSQPTVDAWKRNGRDLDVDDVKRFMGVKTVNAPLNPLWAARLQ